GGVRRGNARRGDGRGLRRLPALTEYAARLDRRHGPPVLPRREGSYRHRGGGQNLARLSAPPTCAAYPRRHQPRFDPSPRVSGWPTHRLDTPNLGRGGGLIGGGGP